MAVLVRRQFSERKGYATMAKSTILPFELPPEFSPDPLTEVIQNGAKVLLRTAIQAEVSGFIKEYVHLLDNEGRQRLVRHGFLPEREVMTGIGTVPVQVPRVRDRGVNEGRQQDQVPFGAGAAVSAQGEVGRGTAALALSEGFSIGVLESTPNTTL